MNQHSSVQVSSYYLYQCDHRTINKKMQYSVLQINQITVLDFSISGIMAHAGILTHSSAGWDVARTDKGACLLEANLSCNFFRGTFDQEAYFEFVSDYFTFLDLPTSDQCMSKKTN